ncbi:MAG: glycosyltransferase family 39 protein [Waterburya sp.]
MVSQAKVSKKPVARDRGWKIPPKPWRFLLITVLIIGIFFRFTNLEQKVYWYDEVSTSLTVVGYTEAEIVQSLNETIPVEPKVIQKYQHFNPQKSVVDTVNRLVQENPHHPPLYYLIARFWSKIFGTSILAMRSLAAIISLLVLPCIYWLCLELFESSITGWVAIALIAISPLHLVYAQEARQYSLWIGIILLSSAALLRAVRVKTAISWGFYGITVALGLYTQLFFGFVALGHGIYLVANEGFRLSKTVKSYLIAFLASLIVFSPWIVILVNQYSQANRLTEWAVIYDQTNEELVKIWIHNLSLAFFDIGQAEYSDKFLIIYVLVVSLVGSAIFFLGRNTPRRIWLFILTLMGASALPLVLPDLLLSGQRTITPRYLIPTYLGIQLAVAYFISNKLNAISIRSWQQKFWQLVTIVLISLGIVSSVIYSQSEIWWNKFLNAENISVSHIINQTTKPVLVSNIQTNFIISLSYMLEPNVRVLIAPQCGNCTLNLQEKDRLSIPTIPEGFSDVFLFKAYPPDSWKNELETQQNYKAELLFEGDVLWLWRLEKIA